MIRELRLLVVNCRYQAIALTENRPEFRSRLKTRDGDFSPINRIGAAKPAVGLAIYSYLSATVGSTRVARRAGK